MEYVIIGIVIITLVAGGAMGLYTFYWNKTWEAFERGYSQGLKDGQENKK
jgi:hypothetical protein